MTTLICLAAWLPWTGASDTQPAPKWTPEQIRALLENDPSSPLIPELEAVPAAERAEAPLGQRVLEWARQAAETTATPETTYTLYRAFRKTGEREPYEKPYFEKRKSLARETLAAWLGGDDSRLDRANDLLWSICEETTWVLPAHEKTPDTIDLFSAETGVQLAHVLYLLGDRLPKEIRARVHVEIRKRIFDLYLEHAREYWWDGGSNNWTGVCAGSVGQTALMLEPDLERQSAIIALVLEQLDRFIRNAFEEDGGCLEGIGYWNYGLIHYVGFAEILRARTDGAIDLLAQEKVRAIAQYPLAVFVGKDTYASFADASASSDVRPFLAARLAERANAPELLGLAGEIEDWRLTTVIRNLLWWDGLARPLPLCSDIVLPASGIARSVGEMGGKPAVLVVKAGSNDEPHNHNDVGSFVLCVDGTTYLCDPGPGRYSAQYFSGKRYDNIFASSYGHSVPRIGDALQHPGGKYRGTLERQADGSLQVSFAGAYGIQSFGEALRAVSFQDGTLVLRDTFTFDGPGVPVEEALVTWLPAEVDGGLVRVQGPTGVLEIEAAEGTFAAERLDKACQDNHKPGVLARLTLTLPAAPHAEARFTMSFHPPTP